MTTKKENYEMTEEELNELLKNLPEILKELEKYDLADTKQR